MEIMIDWKNKKKKKTDEEKVLHFSQTKIFSQSRMSFVKGVSINWIFENRVKTNFTHFVAKAHVARIKIHSLTYTFIKHVKFDSLNVFYFFLAVVVS